MGMVHPLSDRNYLNQVGRNHEGLVINHLKAVPCIYYTCNAWPGLNVPLFITREQTFLYSGLCPFAVLFVLLGTAVSDLEILAPPAATPAPKGKAVHQGRLGHLGRGCTDRV